MTDDQKKALLVAGGVAVVGLAIYLSRGMNILPAGATAQAAPTLPPGPGYTTYNVTPYGGNAVSTTVPPSNDNYAAVGGGCCSGNDGCFTSGGINTGNAPTGLTQLLNWYANSNGAKFVQNFDQSLQGFRFPASTIMEQTAPPLSSSNIMF